MTPVVWDAGLTDPGFWAGSDQDAVFQRLRTEAPLVWQPEPPTVWNPTGGRGFWSVTSHELVRSVSKSPGVFGSRYGTEIIDQDPAVLADAGMLNMDAPEHARMRSVVARVFTPGRVSAFKHDINGRAERLVRRLLELGSFDFVAEVADTYPAGIIADFMGVEPGDLAMLVRLTKQILSPPADEAHRANREMIAYGIDLAIHRRQAPADDLVTHIVQAEVEGKKLTDEEVGTFFALLLTAGIETTGTSLNHAMVARDRHPEQFSRWRSDFSKYSKSAVEEIFRWATPVRRFRRTALIDTELAGTRIAAGDKVVMWFMSANRDDDVFPDPHGFDITRSPNPHVSFGGGGNHFCLGANLARAEVRALMERLLVELPNLRSAGEVVYSRNDAFNAVEVLPMECG